MGVIADIERELARQRCRAREDGGLPELRTSTLTHLVWAPPRWLPQVRSTLAGLHERHPARTIVLIPEPGRRDAVAASAGVREFALRGIDREVVSEVIEVRLRGRPAEHPASIVLPLLLSDLPVFCRWRGEPPWGSGALQEIVAVVDRLVVDSSEWRSPARGFERLERLFRRVAVSDLAYRRTLPWRQRLAELWPGIRVARSLHVTGPRADALLLAGWLRSRLRHEVALRVSAAEAVTAMTVDGAPVEPPAVNGATASTLLSAELDVLARDPVYEAAVRRAGAPQKTRL
jgi:glucose-6-phosphate dehydrogenase assembly protein OpcA